MLARRVARESWGDGISAVCVACILAPLCKPTRIPFVVAILLVQGVLAPSKWLVQPELARVLVWGAVTRELKLNFFITIFL